MRRLLNFFATKLKKEHYELDKNIPIGYLISIIISRFVMAIRGILHFNKIGVFIAQSTTIKCKSKISLKGTMSIARDCYIDALSKNGIVLGKNFSLGKKSSIECTGNIQNIGLGFTAGNNVGIGSYSFLGCAGGLSIGDDTIIGNYVSFHCENHNYSDSKLPIRLQGVNRKGIKIGKSCWIGAKVTILDGTNVGDGCIIAAGAVLTGKSFPTNSIIGGIPAKVIGQRPKCD